MNCKHLDLIVQRNNGVRWVTCMDCMTDFTPVVKEGVTIPVSVAKVIAAWNDNLPKHWVAGDGLTAQEADALMQVRVAYESHTENNQ